MIKKILKRLILSLGLYPGALRIYAYIKNKYFTSSPLEKILKNYLWTSASVLRNQLTAIYEPIQPFIFLAAIKKNKSQIIFDVGANIGLYSVLAASVSTVDKVIAFEAEQEAYKQLCNNIEINKMDDKAETHFVAVSDCVGEVVFGIVGSMSGANGIAETSIHNQKSFNEHRIISSITLDSLFDFSNKSLCLKIDVEGHESAVVQGTLKLLRNNKCFIQIELYKEPMQMIEALSKLGYNKVFNAGADHYFTNLKWTSEDTAELMNEAIADFISASLGKK